ncbi:hypothetical protein [Sporomusa termitida]|uniref:hypothetical protein n=1 Tax=Sporomusa termitida TaxID=2377 RepID=UPI0014797753|nr:hypothetical protein [Sporomusa termitida]
MRNQDVQIASTIILPGIRISAMGVRLWGLKALKHPALLSESRPGSNAWALLRNKNWKTGREPVFQFLLVNILTLSPWGG